MGSCTPQWAPWITKRQLVGQTAAVLTLAMAATLLMDGQSVRAPRTAIIVIQHLTSVMVRPRQQTIRITAFHFSPTTPRITVRTGLWEILIKLQLTTFTALCTTFVFSSRSQAPLQAAV